MTRAESFFARVLTAAVVAGGFALGSCSDRLLVQPAQGIPLRLGLGLASSGATLGSDAAACAKATMAHVRVAQSGGTALDTSLAIAGCSQVITLKVRLATPTGAVGVFVTLLAGTSPLFEGSATVQLGRGQATDAEVRVVPVPGGVAAPDSLRTFTKLGDSVSLGGAVVFATGDTVQGLEPAWADDGKGIVALSHGVVRALAEGSAVLTASYLGLNHVTRATVKAVVASVALSDVADTATVYAGRSRALTAVARDSGQHVLRRSFAWTSGDPRVATVDSAGLVRGVALGRTVIRAASESKADSVTILVARVPVARVLVLPGAPVLQPGETVALQATTYDAEGSVLTGRDVAWSTSDFQVATVTSGGLVRAVSGGTARIFATSEGVSGFASVHVPYPILRVTPAAVDTSAYMFHEGTVSSSLEVTNAGAGVIEGLSAEIMYQGVEYTPFIASATLSSTTTPATLVIQYRDSLWSNFSASYHATVRVSSTTSGIQAVDVPVTFTLWAPTSGNATPMRASLPALVPVANVARPAAGPSY